MKYNYICNTCKKKIIIEKSISDKIERNIPCECGGKLNQNFSLKSIQTNIPCTYDSYGDYHPKNYGTSNLENYIETLDK